MRLATSPWREENLILPVLFLDIIQLTVPLQKLQTPSKKRIESSCDIKTKVGNSIGRKRSIVLILRATRNHEPCITVTIFN